MGISNCDVTIDSNGKELTMHGATMFPIACYDEDFLKHLVPWHWHDDFEIVMIVEGCSHIMVENHNILVKAGDALLINSGVLHSANGGMPEQAHCHSMVFHPRLIGGSMDSIFWQTLVYPFTENNALRWLFLDASLPAQAAVIDRLEAAWNLVIQETENYEIEVRYLLSCSFRALASNLPAPAKTISTKNALAASRTKLMMQFIHEHYTEELTLRQIAGSAAVSESVCLRSFRQMIGIPPMRYVLQYRIEKAAELLTATDQKVHEVALASGFSDFSYFTKCFRELKKCTPVEFRKQF